MYSLETILLLAAVITIGVAVSLTMHHLQKRKEAREVQVKALMSKSKTLVKLLNSLGLVPVDPQLYNTLSKHLGGLAKSIHSLSPNDEGLPALNQAVQVIKNVTPPTEHLPFPPGTQLQSLLKDLKNGSNVISQQLSQMDSKTVAEWKTHLNILTLEVEREYYTHISGALWEKGKKRDALNAINHALNLLEKCQHLSLKERKPIAEALKEKKQQIYDQS